MQPNDPQVFMLVYGSIDAGHRGSLTTIDSNFRGRKEKQIYLSYKK